MANALKTIRNTMLSYTSIRNHPLDAVYHMMLCNGNGYQWNAKGELIDPYMEDDKADYEFSTEWPLQAAMEPFCS